MKNFILFIFVVSLLPISGIVVDWADLTEAQQAMVVPDMAGRVNCADDFLNFEPGSPNQRVLPELAEGWPQTYTSSNCFKGAIYCDMDDDLEMEIIFGVGTKIVAHNLDGSIVSGWPQNLSFYVWGSPACGDIDGDGVNEIVACSRQGTNGNSGELYAFELNGEAVTGFPVVMAGGGTMSATLADLDGDEDLEIFVNVRNSPEGWTYVFDGDGSVFEGWPQALNTFPGSSISVGDITGDGIPEVIGLSYESLYAFDAGGNLLPGFPVSETGYNYSYSQPILVDLDNDGMREIIYGGCSTGGAVFVVKSDGSYQEGWPQTVDHWIFATPAIADLDGDSDLEIIIGDQVSSGTPVDHIYAWHTDGTSVDGFPAGPTNAIYAQSGIADLDGDSLPEIMIDDNVFGNGYECYNNDGSHCIDWPLPSGTGWDSITMQMTPVFGDFDQDGLLEIAGAATGFTTYVVECCLWNTESSWDEELAYMPIDACNIQHDGLYPQEVIEPNDPPESCSASVHDYNSVLVEWIMADAGQDGFMVYANDLQIAEITDPDQRDYDHTDLPAGEYVYYITALYGADESLPSPAVNVEIILAPPYDLRYEWFCLNVELYWDAPQLRDITAYNIYRDSNLIDSIEETGYSDSVPETGTYEYYVTAVYSDSIESEPSNVVVIELTEIDQNYLPEAIKQVKCYPNPFNPEIKISFALSQSQQVDIRIYNTAGQLIRKLVNQRFDSGRSQVKWDGRNDSAMPVSSGLYFMKLRTETKEVSKKLILLK